ncbi:hypothetical protein VNO78_10589 [Psophocarpus tetragonolobus]|uniref:Uncharacterized protein n=1 Tax=Psophocarpus tetragonolobus TaxID=3891 RepID=A0AAN9SLJ4_PSOTE
MSLVIYHVFMSNDLETSCMLFVMFDSSNVGWNVKINVDGSVIGGGQSAGCGGVNRDNDGVWLGGWRFLQKTKKRISLC